MPVPRIAWASNRFVSRALPALTLPIVFPLPKNTRPSMFFAVPTDGIMSKSLAMSCCAPNDGTG